MITQTITARASPAFGPQAGPRHVRMLVRRSFKAEHNPWVDVSLDAPLFEDGTMTLGDTVTPAFGSEKMAAGSLAGGFFCGCVYHSPSAILCLPALVSRSSPGNSSMYPSWISRSLCSGGIARCIGPLAQLRSDTNSSWVSGGTDEPCAIPQIYARNRPFSS
jgi:hypothetical protein